MIEAIIKQTLMDEFIPFTNEASLLETLGKYQLEKTVKVKKKGSWSSMLVSLRSSNEEISNIISSMLLIYNENTEEIVIFANIGEMTFPRIVMVTNIESGFIEVERSLELLFGNGKNYIYVYGNKEEKIARKELEPLDFEKVRKDPMYFYLMKSHRKLTNSVKNQWDNMVKSKIILSSLQDYILNKVSENREFQIMRPERYLVMTKEINTTILMECFFPGRRAFGLLTREKAINQRTSFVGFYLFEKLMDRVQYNEDNWINFLQSEILPGFKNSALNILDEIELAVTENNFYALSAYTRKKITEANSEVKNSHVYRNLLRRDNILEMIKISREALEHNSHKLFSKDEYLGDTVETIFKEYNSWFSKIEEKLDIVWDRNEDITEERKITDRPVEEQEDMSENEIPF